MRLTDSSLCRMCGAEQEASAHVECEASATLRHTYLGSFFLVPEDVRSLGLGAAWNFIKETGLPWLGHLRSTKGLLKRPTYIGTERLEPTYCSILFCPVLHHTQYHIPDNNSLHLDEW